MTIAPQTRAIPHRQAAAHGGKKREISANPQDSSSQALNITSFLDSKSLAVHERGGNRGKVEIRPICDRQVFASMEVAQGMVVTLKSLGISAEPAKCRHCRLIHVL